MPECKDGQELNPLTNRCRKITCKGREVYDSKTRKCVKKRCGKGTIRNKKTNRCVKKTIKCKKGQVIDKEIQKCVTKTCENGKILNIKTFRCIKDNRNITQKIKVPKLKPQPHTKPLSQNNLLIRPPKRELLKDILASYKKMNSTKVIPYTCFDFTEHMMLLHVLNKNKNDCAYDIGLFGHLIAKYKSLTYNKLFVKHIQQHYLRCKQKNKMLVIPLSVLSGRHSNVLIFNPFRNEVERFEPHGGTTGHKSFDDTAINNKLKKFVHEIDSTLKYISPDILCPNGHKGYQRYEQKAMRETGKYNNITISDPNGFCCAWSYFYLDIRLKFPKKSGTELVQESQSILGYNPNELRQFIRGQYTFLVKEINAIDQKYKFEDLLANQDKGRLTKDVYLKYKHAWNQAIYKEFEKLHSCK